jgi:hypothetical protein
LKNRRRKKPILSQNFFPKFILSIFPTKFFLPKSNPFFPTKIQPNFLYPFSTLSQLSQILCRQILPKIPTHSSVHYHPKSLSTPQAKTGEQFSTALEDWACPMYYTHHLSLPPTATRTVSLLSSYCLPTVSLLCEITAQYSLKTAWALTFSKSKNFGKYFLKSCEDQKSRTTEYAHIHV